MLRRGRSRTIPGTAVRRVLAADAVSLGIGDERATFLASDPVRVGRHRGPLSSTVPAVGERAAATSGSLR